MYNRCTLVEFRGVWVTSVYNIDWPITLDDKESQKQEFVKLLDILKCLNINAVFVQIRPASDALYKSNINPWSEYLTGVQGKDPEYDPLQFMIEETHKRNMEFHAWLNPYRVTTKGTDLSKLAPNNPARIKPEWVLAFEDSLFYNPENPEVIEYVAVTVYEIITNYDVDGIHFDDYFYPYNYPLPKGEDRDGEVANNRREAVTNLIRLVYNVIKSTKPCVQFGVSPFGVWKNKSSDENGSDSKNLESYYDIYMDTITWINEHIVDYIAPQIYWTTENENTNYEVMVNWWNNVVEDTGVVLYIGQNISNPKIVEDLENQIEINREYNNVTGNILFSSSNIVKNTDDVVKKLKNVYNCKAVLPRDKIEK